MCEVDEIAKIRDMYFRDEKSYAQIAKDTGRDWRTIKKYCDLESFSPDAPVKMSPRAQKIDPYKSKIDEYLMEDVAFKPGKSGRRKQVHTAKKVYELLQAEFGELDCCYKTVSTYVKQRRLELWPEKQKGYIPLVHPPGKAQADFGTAAFYEGDNLWEQGKYLVVSFPYSNAGFAQLCYGENLQCLLESLVRIFHHIGGVPQEIWFDNASSIVIKILSNGDRKVTETFQRFAMHYGFKPQYMNPSSGNEKGNVENKVGYIRKNFLVPVPRFTSLEDYNNELLKRCDSDMSRPHYKKNEDVCVLFAQDQMKLLPLPKDTFDTARYETVLTDKCGRFTIDGLYIYSASPDYPHTHLTARLTATTVTVMDPDMKPIVTHRRLYGPDKIRMESIEWLPYLNLISRKPRSLRNTGIYDMLPETVREYVDQCAPKDLSRTLKALAQLTEISSFEAACVTVADAIRLQVHDPDSLMALYRRAFSDLPVLEPISDQELPDTAKVAAIQPNRGDLAALDEILRSSGGISNG